MIESSTWIHAKHDGYRRAADFMFRRTKKVMIDPA